MTPKQAKATADDFLESTANCIFIDAKGESVLHAMIVKFRAVDQDQFAGRNWFTAGDDQGTWSGFYSIRDGHILIQGFRFGNAPGKIVVPVMFLNRLEDHFLNYDAYDMPVSVWPHAKRS